MPDVGLTRSELAFPNDGEPAEGVSDFSKQKEEHQRANLQLSPTPFRHRATLAPEKTPFIAEESPIRNSIQQSTSSIQYERLAKDSNKEYEISNSEFPSFERDTNKKMNKRREFYEKRNKYAVLSDRGETQLYTPDLEPRGNTAQPNLRGVKNAANDRSHPAHGHSSQQLGLSFDKTATMDFYAAKSTAWKKLGPNVEISTSAEHPIYYKKDPSPELKNANKRRKTSPKNVRAGYLNQQHALYIANNLANLANLQTGLRSIKEVFDHNNVLKQSDKFELADARFQGLEDATKQNNEAAQIRTKQESPAEQFYKFQKPEINNAADGFQRHYSANMALLNTLPRESSVEGGKYYQPRVASSVSRGFIRNIELETSPSGGKKMIAALIIPLISDQINHNQLFDHEIGLHVNNQDVLNSGGAKIRHGQPFLYEMVDPRYSHSEISPVENYQQYQQQISTPYEFRVAQESYHPFLNYQYRLPYNLDSVSSTPASANKKSPGTRTADAVYSVKKKPVYKSTQQRQLPVRTDPLSQIQPSEKLKVDHRIREEYVFDANDDEHYLLPSESFTTVTSVRDRNEHQKTKTKKS